MNTASTMNVFVEESNGVTFAEVFLFADIHPYIFKGNGCARRDPHDRNNRTIGKSLAVSRAIASANRKLERAVQGAIKHADDVAAMQARQPHRSEDERRQAIAARSPAAITKTSSKKKKAAKAAKVG